MNQLVEIEPLQIPVVNQPLTPPTSYNTITATISDGIYYLCNTKCTCGCKLILHIEVGSFLIKQVFGQWWVRNPTGPAGNMANTFCPHCRPRDKDKISGGRKKPEKIRLPGLAAVEKYQQQNAQPNQNAKPAPT